MEELVFIGSVIIVALLFWLTTGDAVAGFTSMLAIGPLLGSLGYLATYRVRHGDWGVENG